MGGGTPGCRSVVQLVDLRMGGSVEELKSCSEVAPLVKLGFCIGCTEQVASYQPQGRTTTKVGSRTS